MCHLPEKGVVLAEAKRAGSLLHERHRGIVETRAGEGMEVEPPPVNADVGLAGEMHPRGLRRTRDPPHVVRTAGEDDPGDEHGARGVSDIVDVAVRVVEFDHRPRRQCAEVINRVSREQLLDGISVPRLCPPVGRIRPVAARRRANPHVGAIHQLHAQDRQRRQVHKYKICQFSHVHPLMSYASFTAMRNRIT